MRIVLNAGGPQCTPRCSLSSLSAVTTGESIVSVIVTRSNKCKIILYAFGNDLKTINCGLK